MSQIIRIEVWQGDGQTSKQIDSLEFPMTVDGVTAVSAAISKQLASLDPSIRVIVRSVEVVT